jgi:multicopper oxidase
VLAACGAGGGTARPSDSKPAASAVPSTSTTGRTRSFQLRARSARVDLGGRVVDTWTFGTALPGTTVRATAGDRVKVAFANDLPAETSVHWHGLAIRNAMDGVPGVTTPPVSAGGQFAFDFVVPYAGTHWFDPHTGLQLDRGLYAPFIVDDPHEPGSYDHEWILVLDDWTDGVGGSPEQIFADLKAGSSTTSTGASASAGMGGMGGMDMSGTGSMGGSGMTGDGGDVAYPLYLINGRGTSDPDVLTAKKGQRVRLRIINAGADTMFDVAVGGHRMQVTHSDGYPVDPVSTQSLRIGMGERYDATITLGDGVFPVVARPVGKSGTARALIRTGAGTAPAADALPGELNAQPLTVSSLHAGVGAALEGRTPSSTQNLRLAGSMSTYVWTINGRTYDNTRALTAHLGRTTRLRIQNMSMMSHPIHIHGHTFQIGPAGGTGPRKDTVLVVPMRAVEVDLLADNPGKWMIHCHNAYHAEAGMMTRLEYAT